jgi:hypothetical protein
MGARRYCRSSKLHAYPMINFVTAWVGNQFSIDYPINLYRGIKRFYKKPFKFTIITDDYTTQKVIDCPKMTAATFYVDGKFPTWWSKIAFFHPDFQKAVFFDLDTIITGPIDNIGYGIEGEVKFAILENFLQPPVRNPAIKNPCKFGSAVMWRSPYSQIYRIIYDVYLADPAKVWDQYKKDGDQKFIEEMIEKYALPYSYIQDHYPKNYFRSVKFPEALTDAPEGNHILCYHGYPRPHEDSNNKIIQEWWT